MNKRDRGGRSGGGRSFGNKRSDGRFHDQDRSGQTMYQATCAECGKSCEVPFKPRGGRPIYCSDCFGKHNSRDGRRSGSGFGDQSHFSDRKMFTATCDSCGQRCEVPFRPSGDKPVYCRNCFDKINHGGKQGNYLSYGQSSNKELIDQVKALNVKLDTVLSVLAPETLPKTHIVKAKRRTDVKQKSKSSKKSSKNARKRTGKKKTKKK